MRLRNTLVGNVSPEEIALLLSNEVPESRILEYKAELPGTSSKDRKDFLADVSALANTAGGVIVYGAREKKGPDNQNTGIPESVPGIPNLNPGSEELRLTSMVLDGVAPPIGAMLKFQAVDVPTGEKVLLLGVPQSYSGPHMVTFEKSNKFWRRTESGNYSPGVMELRSMFNERGTWRDEAEAFRRERVALILSGQAIDVDRSSSTFFHVIPLGRLDMLVDLKPHENLMATKVSPPASGGGYNWHWNVDGFLNFTTDHNSEYAACYTQWFRFAGVEGYSARFVRDLDGKRQFFVRHMVDTLQAFVADAVAVLNQVLQTPPPYAVMVSLAGARSAQIGDEYLFSEVYPVEQNRIFLPPAILETGDDPTIIGTSLHPLSDSLWQCGGLRGVPPARRR